MGKSLTTILISLHARSLSMLFDDSDAGPSDATAYQQESAASEAAKEPREAREGAIVLGFRIYNFRLSLAWVHAPAGLMQDLVHEGRPRHVVVLEQPGGVHESVELLLGYRLLCDLRFEDTVSHQGR